MKVLRNIELSQIVGAVINNKAAYYNYADYDQISFCIIGIKIDKEIDLGNGIAMPFSLDYIHNAATKNTELFGKNFLVATISLKY